MKDQAKTKAELIKELRELRKKTFSSEQKTSSSFLDENLILHSIISGAKDAVFAKDADRKYIYVNPAMEQILGLSSEKLLGKKPEELFDKQSASIIREVDAKNLAGEKVDERKTITVGDTQRVFHTIQYPITDNLGKVQGICGIVREITEVVKITEHLNKGQAIAHLGTFEYDLKTALVLCSDEMLRIWGKDPGNRTMSLDEILNVIHPDDRDRVRSALEESFASHQPFDCVFRIIVNKATRFIHGRGEIKLDENNIAVSMTGTGQDITEKIELEQQLRESEEKYRMLFDNATVLISLFEKKGTCLMMNKRAAKNFGGNPEDFIGISFSELHPVKGREYTRRVREVIDSGVAKTYEDCVSFNREERFFLSNIRPVRNAQGEIYAAQIVSQDFTERKKIEEELYRSQKQLKNVLMSISDGFFSLDKDFTVIFFNKAAGKLLNKKSKEVIGRQLFDAFPEAKGSVFEEKYRQALKTKKFISFETFFGIEPYVNWFSVRVYPFADGISVFFQVITKQKELEFALLESEKKYRDLFENNVNAIIIADATTRIFIDCNKKAQELTGYSREELLGFSVDRLHPKDRIEDTLDAFEKQIRKKLHEYETEILTKEKERIHVSISASVITIGGKECVQGVFRDISAQKKAIEALISSEYQYRQLYENMRDGIVTVDMQGKFVHCNKAYERMLGYTLGELRQLSYHDITPKKWEKIEEDIVQKKIIKEGFSGIYEKEYIRKNGEIFPIELTSYLIKGREGNPVGMWGIVRDIRERKQNEKELKDSENRFRSMFEKHNAIMMLIEPDSGKIILANKSAADFYGYSQRKLSSMTIDAVNCLAPEEVKNERENARKGVKNVFIFPHKLKNDRVRTVEVHSTPIFYEEKQILFSIIHDITDREDAKRELEKYHMHLEKLVEERTYRLQESNKELESFSYSVSHDLRAPLRAIDGFGRIITERYADKLDSEGQDYIQRMVRASNRMSDLIDDMLGLSRVTRQSLKIQPLNLTVLIKDIAEKMAKDAVGRTVSVTVEENLSVFADKHLMEIVFRNLLENAFKFTSRKKHAIIKVEKCLANGKSVICISDNGVGYDMKYADKLFVAFQRLHAQKDFSGTGIGLATVKRIVTRHNGEVWSETKKDKGARFYVWIPEEGITGTIASR